LNVSLFIAKRYFFSKKKKNFINVISIISMIGVAVGTMALIVVLSVFNGLEGLLRSLYGSFDPDIRIEANLGKSFVPTDALMTKVTHFSEVSTITEVIEDNALVKYKDSQLVVRIKGVSNNFIDQNRLKKAIVQGELALYREEIPYAIVGRGVQYLLSLTMQSNDFHALQIFSPKNVAAGTFNPSKLFNQRNILPSGVFAIEKQYDEKYIFVPIEFAKELFEYDNKLTSLELMTKPDTDIKALKSELEASLGAEFRVLTSAELHADLYKLLRWEKFFVFFTFAFILAIASFNIFFSLSMLAIEKRPDIAILNAMGADRSLIRRIFLLEGGIIAISGAGVGLALGMVICWLQQTFGLVSMGMTTALIDAYPVVMKPMDFLNTGILIFFITLLASYRPASIAANSLDVKHVQ
jgi:lipoprotein-releasing system permease protein